MDQQSKQRGVSAWRRVVLRMAARASWHIRGLLLWLLQRPGLRWVPLPYPAIGNVQQWRAQAESMCASKVLPKRHYVRALQHGMFTAQNLADAVFLRNRMGFELAFLEDPLLMGMLAARAGSGMAQKIRAEAHKEAKAEAEEARRDGRQQAAVRELIGPRGGLPTLRKDLLKLAALLHVTVEEKDTVPKIRELCKPMVDLLLKGKDKEPPAEVSRAKSATVQAEAKSMASAQFPAPEVQWPTLDLQDPSVLPLQQVQQMMVAQEEKFQGMLSQVFQHVMSMQNNPNVPELPGVERGADSVMEERGNWSPTESEKIRIQADYHAEMREERTRMGGSNYASQYE